MGAQTRDYGRGAAERSLRDCSGAGMPPEMSAKALGAWVGRSAPPWVVWVCRPMPLAPAALCPSFGLAALPSPINVIGGAFPSCYALSHIEGLCPGIPATPPISSPYSSGAAGCFASLLAGAGPTVLFPAMPLVSVWGTPGVGPYGMPRACVCHVGMYLWLLFVAVALGPPHPPLLYASGAVPVFRIPTQPIP
jgi:hypothetical protein